MLGLGLGLARRARLLRRDLRHEILDLVGEMRRLLQLRPPLRLQRYGEI